MWGFISTAFLGIYCLMSFYLGRSGWKVVGKSRKSNRIVYGILLALLIFTFPLAEIAEDWLPQTQEQWLTIAGWYTMIAVVYLCLILIIIDSLLFLDSRIRIIPKVIRDHEQTPKVVASLILAAVTITLIYGSWNARHPVVTHYELSVDKEAGPLDQLQIAMVSDIHYGTIIDIQRLDRMLEVINELQPDVIVMAGDIVEGTVTKEDAQKLMGVIKQMYAKYGIFAVPGNHDRWVRSNPDLVHKFQEAGVEVLIDRQLKVADSFYIVGRDDPGHRRTQGRKDIGELMQGIAPSLPVILLDHQPIDVKAAKNNQVDLQLSGHTHKGQIFPSHLITSQIYEIDWGLLSKDNYHLIVSSGYGTWGPPLRIGTNPEVVYVTLRFKW